MTDNDRPEGQELLTVTEVAKLLRVDPATVRRWIASGRLPAIKPGRDYRIRRIDADQLLGDGRYRESHPMTINPEDTDR